MEQEQNGAEQMVDLVGCLAEVLGVFYVQLTRHGMSDVQALTLTNQLLTVIVDAFLDEAIYYEEDESEEEE